MTDPAEEASIVHIDFDVCELAVRILEAENQRSRPYSDGKKSLATLTEKERLSALRAAYAALRYFNELIMSSTTDRAGRKRKDTIQ